MQIKPVHHYGSQLGLDKSARLIVGPVAFPAMFDKDGGVSFPMPDADPLVVRSQIIKLANELLALPDQRELPVAHEFAKGMYIRRLFIPKGTLLVGKIHKQECINVVERGDIAILTETGSKRITAGFTLVSPPGMQKVGYANEDTIFTNIFRTDETDIDKLETELVWDSYEAMERLTAEGIELCQ
jgi:hypothetical protein